MARIAQLSRFGEFLDADLIRRQQHLKRCALRDLARQIGAGTIGEARRDPGFCRYQRCRLLQRRLQAGGSCDQRRWACGDLPAKPGG